MSRLCAGLVARAARVPSLYREYFSASLACRVGATPLPFHPSQHAHCSTASHETGVNHTVIHVSSTRGEEVPIAAAWLRGLARDSFHESSGQRTLLLADIPHDIAVTGLRYTDGGKRMAVEFSDGCVDTFDTAFVLEEVERARSRGFFQASWIPGSAHYWDRESVGSRLTNVDYDEYMAHDATVLKVLQQLATIGMARLSNAPTERSTVEEIAERINVIRNTFYGRSWDVVSLPSATNIAYTSLPLDFHQDLLYFENPPGLQLLHCMENSAEGGQGVFVDGWRVVHDLREANEPVFRILSTMRVTYRFEKDGQRMQHSWPLIRLADEEPHGVGVYYSPQFEAPLRVQPEEYAEFHRAYATFVRACRNESLQYRLAYAPGDCVLFDNRRILHARSPITRAGNRHLRGTYIDRDAWWSRLRALGDEAPPS